MGAEICSLAWCRFEAAWKDPECDKIYEHLRREMEIDRRYEALEDKVRCSHPLSVLHILSLGFYTSRQHKASATSVQSMQLKAIHRECGLCCFLAPCLLLTQCGSCAV